MDVVKHRDKCLQTGYFDVHNIIYLGRHSTIYKHKNYNRKI